MATKKGANRTATSGNEPGQLAQEPSPSPTNESIVSLCEEDWDNYCEDFLFDWDEVIDDRPAGQTQELRDGMIWDDYHDIYSYRMANANFPEYLGEEPEPNEGNKPTRGDEFAAGLLRIDKAHMQQRSAETTESKTVKIEDKSKGQNSVVYDEGGTNIQAQEANRGGPGDHEQDVPLVSPLSPEQYQEIIMHLHEDHEFLHSVYNYNHLEGHGVTMEALAQRLAPRPFSEVEQVVIQESIRAGCEKDGRRFEALPAVRPEIGIWDRMVLYNFQVPLEYFHLVLAPPGTIFTFDD